LEGSSRGRIEVLSWNLYGRTDENQVNSQSCRWPKRDSNRAFSKFRSRALPPRHHLGFYSFKCYYNSICLEEARISSGLRIAFHNIFYINYVLLDVVKTKIESTLSCDCFLKSRPTRPRVIQFISMYQNIKPTYGSLCIYNGKYPPRRGMKYCTITVDFQNQKCYLFFFKCVS
jgi:hypothetical protein